MNDLIWSMHAALSRMPVWVGITLVVVCTFCILAFAVRNRAFKNNRPLDGRLSYTSKDVTQVLKDLGENGRGTYALTELTLDVLFSCDI